MILINENCVGCGQCAAFCRVNAIEIFARAMVNQHCIKCGQCKDSCPVDAISVVDDE